MSQRVVIAGGGFGGYYTAKTLERVAPKDVRVTLINDVNFMLYAPVLPGAAAGTLEPRHVVVPLRERLKRTSGSAATPPSSASSGCRRCSTSTSPPV